MKTSINTGEVSSHPAREATRTVKIRGEHRGGSEKQDFGVAKQLADLFDGGIIEKHAGLTQFAL